jgi:hypothetical protein
MKRYRSSAGERIRLPLFWFILLFYVSLWAQIPQDTTRVQSLKEKSPTGAMIRAALFPGLGQFYNRQIIKGLVVIGGELALLGNVIYYHQKAVKSNTDWEYDFYLDYKTQYIWWLVAVHLISMLDAFVDAHLWDFDAGPDLSVGGMIHPNGMAILSLNLEF